MMNYKVAIAATLAVVFCFEGVNAKTLRNADEPAEFPPSSFSGKQYVDSRGCVFIRAGIDGNVTWIPRVSRSRSVICGFKPTNAGAVAALPVVPAKKSASNVVRIEVPQIAAKPTAAPKVRRSAPALKAAPKPVVRRVAVQPKPILRAPVIPVVASKPVVRRGTAIAKATPRVAKSPVTRQASSCAGFSAMSQKYMGRSTSKLPVRCGPQARTAYAATGTRSVTAPSAPVPMAAAILPTRRAASRTLTQRVVRAPAPTVQIAPTAKRINGNTRIVPRHVYETQRVANTVTKPPRGYRSAWNDDRLNTRRAQQTVRGLTQMDLVWTQEVPRRLINANTGKDVTGKFPKLLYPYVDMEAQLRYRGTSSTIGQTTRRAVLRNPTVRASTKSIAPKPQAQRRQTAKTTPTTSRSVAATGHKYVQVGTFGVDANATQSAAHLRGLGLPVRTGTLKRASKSYRVVLAGPFSNPSQLTAALRRVRSAGYSDAFLR